MPAPVSVRLGAPAFAAVGLASLSLFAAPVLHEYFAPTAEDATLGATVPGTRVPSVLETQSGTVSAPELGERRSPLERTYGATLSEAQDSKYQIDRDTSRPDMVSYDDPFTPSIPPFKRSHAYDAVNSDLELIVARPELKPVLVGGRPGVDDDQFYASLLVELGAGTPTRIPTVGPGTRALVAHTQPEVAIEILEDSAENWFVRAGAEGQVRLVLHLAIDRGAFGSDFASVSWQELRSHLPNVPANVQEAASFVAAQIGVSSAQEPRDVVRKMVSYFRGFSPSELRPASGGALLYRDIALGRIGVCRHRSYAFVITAIGIGLPARLIRNEAHAWVEVSDGRLWHRIDLGGAAGHMEVDVDERPSHVTPPDPYQWPPGGEPGLGMARRALAGGHHTGQAGTRSSARQTADAGAPPLPLQAPLPTPSLAPPSAQVTASFVRLTTAEKRAQRGSRVAVTGNIESARGECPHVRVDIELLSEFGTRTALGALMTDADGRFEGRMVVPYDITVGEYELVASTPGDSTRCGPGSSAESGNALRPTD